MRPVEIVVLAADLVAFVLALVPLRGRARWLRHAVLLPLPAIGWHLLVEGPRWQLVPAYALGGVFFLVWLARLRDDRDPAERPARRRRLRRLGTALGAVLGVVVLAVSVALPVVFPVFRFPRPTGPYGIGTVTHHWVDSRPEVFTADPADRRELMVQIWYPAVDEPSAPRAPYVPDAGVLAPLARLGGLPGFALGHLKYVTTNAIPSAPVADAERSYPLLVLATGRGGYRQYDTLGVEELVSHGYVVAAIDHPYADAGVVYPDGRVASFDDRMLDRGFVDSMVPYLAQDAVFTLDQLTGLNTSDPDGVLTGRIDLAHVGLFGLSLGGEITAEACRRDQRFAACLPIDSWMPPDVAGAGLAQPTMWLTRDVATMRLEGWAQADIDRLTGTMQAVYDKLPGDGYIVRVPGMFHPAFGDAQLISPLTRWLGISGPMDGTRAHRIVNAYSLAFFDRYLRNRPSALLAGPAREYPEVLFETRHP